MPENDLRAEKVKALLARGRATMHEILTACFGEWPLKGLDLHPEDELIQEVKLGSMRTFVDDGDASPVAALLEKVFLTFSMAGMGKVNGPRAIYMNTLGSHYVPKFFGKNDLVAKFGHEAIHALQGDFYFRARETFEPVIAKRLQGFAIGEISSDVIAGPLKDDDAGFTGLFHKAKARLLNIGLSKGIDYYKKGSEIQARLIEIMIEGYQVWKRMPGNPAEFYMALTDAGLEPPPSVLHGLQNAPATAHGQEFLTGLLPPSEAAGHLQLVNDSLSPEKRELFWQEILPMLYADMIEMMGDKIGRERFGFGKNPLEDGSTERIVPGAYTRPVSILPS